eukprot:2973807-Alexandrium_andersonii.AAC.1
MQPGTQTRTVLNKMRACDATCDSIIAAGFFLAVLLAVGPAGVKGVPGFEAADDSVCAGLRKASSSKSESSRPNIAALNH